MNRLKFYRFNELNHERINQDNHMHTNWTDGTCSVKEMICAAEEKNLSSIAFTEHICKDSDYYLNFFKEVDELRKKSSLEILIGVEAKVINESGDIDISSENYDLAEIVLGSVHKLFKEGESLHARNGGKDFVVENEYCLTLAMIERNKIDVLAHPFGMSIRFYQTFHDNYVRQIIEKIAATDIAFEFNPSYCNDAFLKLITKYCKKYNPYISIGSDAHMTKTLGKARELMEAVILEEQLL